MQHQTKVSRVTADDGISVFYRSAGSPTLPTLLLLHGFPSSSHQFRNLIPLLSQTHHVVAPDLPGFGFTTVPPERNYKYTFANLSTTLASFLDALSISTFSVYIFDYGAPTALRLALRRPQAITAIITQNGNAYTEGFGKDFWAPLEKYWASNSPTDRNALRIALTLDTTRWQYEAGHSHPAVIPPEAPHLDYALMQREGNDEIQLDLFKDYGTNVQLYPQFHEWFRTSKVPVLAAWGRNDAIFVKEGVEPFRRDVEDLEVRWLDAGHFAIEGNEVEMAGWIEAFLKRVGA